MSGKLRKKFILITAVSIFIVMTLVVGAINIINRRNTVAGLDSMLQIIASGELTMKTSSSEDTLPQTPSGTAPQYGNGQDGDNQKNGGPGGLSPEAQYKTRYFTVTLADDGSVTRTFTDKIAAVTAEEAASLGQSVYASGGTSGFSGVYRYLVTEVNGSHVVIFLDSQSELEAVRSLTGTSCIVGIASYAAAMLMIVLLSRRAVRPLERNEEKQKRFITDASHELKTPLTVISANMDVLGMDVGENEWLTSTRQQITKMRQLISEMVTLTRLDEARPKTVPEPFSLSQAAEDISGPFHAAAVSRGVGLETDLAPDVTYTGDAAAVSQLISILLDNAVKYCEAGGTVTVSLAVKKRPVLTVSNPCASVAQLELDRLFDRFYRGDPARGSTGGFGLGLSIAKSICDAQHLTIRAVSPDADTISFIVGF